MNDYVFNKKLFTKVFWRLREAKTRFVINYGGANSSKSWSQAQHEIIELLSCKGDTLVLRKIGAELFNSVYFQIKKIIELWDLSEEFICVFSGAKREIFHKPTGNRFVFAGLDDPAKLKSMLNIRRVWGEEAEEMDLDDHNEINRRVRGFPDCQITYTFNPILETHWLKTHFFDVPEIAEQTTHIFSTVKDNHFASAEEIKALEDYKLYDINQYNIYFLGQWGKPGAKRPFAFAFKDHHIGHGLTHNAKYTVYLSFDFNVDPITCIAVQYGYEKNRLWIHVIKEFRLPNSDIYNLCKEIRTYFYETIYFKITGDATGQARTAMTKGHTNYYLIIKSELRLTNANFDVPKSNPSVKNTRVLMNTLFMREDVLIDDSCKYLIDDLHYVEVNEHGEVDKRKAEADGMNHLLDCFRYYCYRYHQRYLKNVPKKLQS
jgi:phage terminase large subunit